MSMPPPGDARPTFDSPPPAYQRIGVVPLYSRRPAEDVQWIGALLSRLLTDYLQAMGITTIAYDHVIRQLEQQTDSLPLAEDETGPLLNTLQAKWLIHGRYNYDEASRLFGVRLLIETSEGAQPPLEAAAPQTGFARFMERLILAILERLGTPVTDDARRAVRMVPCPQNFEALRQLAAAQAAWSQGDNELALASLEAALQLDSNYELAAAVQVAVAREANDVITARQAFNRWATLARRQGDDFAAAERTMLLAHWLMELSEWDEAKDAYENARALYKNAKRQQEMAYVLDNIANIDLMRGKTQSAIKTYRRSLRIFEDEDTAPAEVAMIYYNLSLAHKELGQYEEAMRAVDRSLALATKQPIRDPILQARAFAQRGAIQAETGEWQAARKSYDRALSLLAEQPDATTQAMVKAHIAILQKQQGAYSQAQTSLQEAEQLLASDLFEHPHEQAIIQLVDAELTYARRNFQEALRKAKAAQQTFERFQSNGWASRADDLVAVLNNHLIDDVPPTSIGPSTPP